MRWIVGGGGTGGHLIPGIAVYEALKKQNNEVLYVLREQDLSYDASQRIDGNDRITVSLQGMSRKFSIKTFKNIWHIFKTWLSVFLKIKNFQPQGVIITGGYVSNIAALSAAVLRIPLFILEQNSVAGVTNHFWSKFAVRIYTAFPTPNKIPIDKALYTGNPLLYKRKIPVDEAKKIFEVSGKVIGISGGSQGAKTINNMICALLPKLLEKEYSLIWSLGTKEYERFQQEGILAELEKYQQHVKIFRFISEMDMFWSACDKVIARAGAGTISEALLFETYCIMIPIYNSPDNHQYLNALFLKEQGLASIIEEPDLSEELLFHELTISGAYHGNTLTEDPVNKILQDITSYIKKTT